MPAAISVKAPAKINLTLEVLRKRPDGYHEVATILQTIDLWDHITFAEAAGISLECNLKRLEVPDNLAVQAAHLLAPETGSKRGVAIHLEKHIPEAAGLGGGSSDAAATLLALNHLWGRNLSHEKLAQLAAKLGSDVPFFLTGGTALATGRGEQVQSLPPLRQTWLVLLTPSIELPHKTATLYGLLQPHDWADGSVTQRAADALRRGERIASHQMVDTFERVAHLAFPGLERIAQTMRDVCGDAHLVGAGPSLFSIVPDQVRGEQAVKALKARGMQAWCVTTVEHGVKREVEK